MVARIVPTTFVLALLLVAALFAVYWSGLYGGFFFDDEANILLVEAVRLKTISFESLLQVWSSGHSGPSGRPIAQLSFALNHYFSRFDPFAFKLTNLVIHFSNSILVFLFSRQLLVSTRPTKPPGRESLLACIVAFSWAIHPIQMTSVLYVVQRMTSLSAFFLFSALILHLIARERGDRIGLLALIVAWGICWPLSFFSKETGILFPLFVLAWELILRRHTHKTLDLFARSLIALSLLAMVASAVYLILPTGRWLWWTGYEMRPFTLGERLLTEGRVLCFYIGLILFPRLNALGLYHDDFVLSTSLFSPWTTLPALAVLASLVWLVGRMKDVRPLASFGIAWFLIGHLLESTFIPLELAHEHRNYLPLLGILLACADTLMLALEKKGFKKTVAVTLTATVLAYLPFITALRAHQFGDSVRLTQIEAEYHRGSSRAQYEAGRALAEMPVAALPNQPIYSFARRYFEQATKLDPHSKLGLLGLISLACKAGTPVEFAWPQELELRLRLPPFAPADRNILFSLKEMSIAGSICLPRKDIDGLFNAALSNPKASPGAQSVLLSWYADYLWLHDHDLPAAQLALKQSLGLDPGNPSNRLKWAQLLLLSGEPEKARQLLLELQDAQLSAEEQKTRTELLAGFNITGR